MMQFALLALGLFFVTSALSASRTVTSGSITLEPGKRYRITVLLGPDALMEMAERDPTLLTSEANLVKELATKGAFEMAVKSTSAAGMTITALVIPTSPTTLTIGQSVVNGKLLSVERLS